MLREVSQHRKARVLQFLYESNLINRENTRVVDLSGADLGGVYLREANLREADLQGTDLNLARYDEDTVWPAGFDPEQAGAVKQVE